VSQPDTTGARWPSSPQSLSPQPSSIGDES
jgi:hypothetical protein